MEAVNHQYFQELLPPCTELIRSKVNLLLPNLPGAILRLPEVFEDVFLPERVHALPEGGMPVSHQLTILRQSFQGIVLPDRVISIDIVEYLWLEDEVGAIDPPLPNLGFSVNSLT